jgi:hypothetical protein
MRNPMWLRGMIAAGALAASLLLLPTTAEAASINVPCDPTGGALQSAIMNAMSGDTLVLASGCTYSIASQAAPGEALPVINKKLSILGRDAIIERSPTASTNFGLFEVDSGGNLSLTELTVRNGKSVAGGGIFVHGGQLTTNVVTIMGNTASFLGGGVELESGTATFNASTIKDNATTGTYTDGGGIDLEPDTSVTLNASSVTGNTSGVAGGGIAMFVANLIMNATRVSGNTASNGGGLSISGNAIIRGSSVTDNTAAGSVPLPIPMRFGIPMPPGAWGGGILMWEGTLDLTSTSVRGNTASGTESRGGGLYNRAAAMLTGGSVTNNQALGTGAQGGGVFSTGTTTLIANPVTNNIPNNCGSPSTVRGCS